MATKQFYQQVSEVRESIPGPQVVVVSLATPDGGRPGVLSEVRREIAAFMVVEHRARLASPEESREFLDHQAEALRAAEERAALQKIHFAPFSPDDMAMIRSVARLTPPAPAPAPAPQPEPAPQPAPAPAPESD
jgi:hypothetical protein